MHLLHIALRVYYAKPDDGVRLLGNNLYFTTLNHMKNDLPGYVGDTFSRTTKEPLNRGL